MKIAIATSNKKLPDHDRALAAALKAKGCDVLPVIDDDAFAWFLDHGGMTRENGQRFQELVLARAGTEDAAAMYRHFRGRDAALEPLLQQRGLVSHSMKPSRNL